MPEEMMNLKVLIKIALPKIFENIAPEGHFFSFFDENTDLKIFIDMPEIEDVFYVITISKRSAIDGSKLL
ncbi:hypothetical protein LCGC14_1413120 [marine sediment metagenome]|uniref:Uncharacterized protein n=1 Tax=marine sediment metagenome TaxID=412755 RepID=A0A0F9JTL1_9ZZZZ